MKTTRLKKQKKRLLATAVIGVLLLSSCTKEIPFKALPAAEKEDVVDAFLIDTKADYLFSTSMQNGSRSSSDALPFSTGDNKRVKLEMTEDKLRIVEKERDTRFASNDTNDKLLLEVPIEHVQFQCAKDKYGECTNSEEKADDIHWSARNQIKVKLADAKSAELDLLPILDSETFGDNCYEQVTARVKSYKIESDAINFQIERTFKTRLECLSGEATLSDAIVTAVYHYSLVKLDKVLSKDFKTISYPEGSADENTFGFFSSQRKVLDVDNNDTQKSLLQVMNHWNPNRSVIDYYLSDEFAKPQNKMIKDLTYKTVDNLNDGLAEAGVKFRIKLHEPEGKVPGDIRNSMIVLVEDPVASSVIGYGPQTEDPITGEIISARTVMFLGTIKKFIKYTYDDILREKKKAALQKKSTLAANLKLSDSLVAKFSALKASGQTAGANVLTNKALDLIKVNTPVALAAEQTTTQVGEDALATNISSRLAKLNKEKTAKTKTDIFGHDLKSRLRYLQTAKNCSYSPNIEAGAGGISTKLLSQFSDDAKPWEQLSDKEKEDVIVKILPAIWIPTLIHELGHNLGLRHNFEASFDKDNFFNSAELARKNIDHEVLFSSVMDYGNDLKTSPVLGKYDIAALKFGYSRQVEVIDANKKVVLTPIKSTLEEMLPTLNKTKSELKNYSYCTDENVGVSTTCKRFDLGTSNVEIVNDLIKTYNENYSSRNLRNGRASFSSGNDITYARRIKSIFNELRLAMEARERLKYMFELEDNSPYWETIPFLADINKASQLSGAFLAQVLFIPDTLCAVAKEDDLSKIVAIVPLNKIKPTALSCFDVAKDDFNIPVVVVAEGGRSFNSKKDTNNPSPYINEIDVRGIWADKMMAQKVLLNRQIGVSTFDKNNDNYLDNSALRDDLIKSFNAIMNNNVVDLVEFTLADGSKASAEIAYDLYETQVVERPLILSSLEQRGYSDETLQKVADILGVNAYGSTQLQEKLVDNWFNLNFDSTGQHIDGNQLSNSVLVSRFALTDLSIDRKAKSYADGNFKFVASSNNTLALSAIDNLSVTTVLDKLSAEELDKVIEDKKNKVPVNKKASENIKAAMRLPLEKIEDYQAGLIKDTAFYTRLLHILPLTRK